MSTDYKTTSSNNHLGQTQRVKSHLELTGKKKAYKRRRNSKVQQRIDWRRNKISEYLVKGMSLPEISRVMNIPYDTLYKDQCFLIEQARDNMKHHITDLPFQMRQATEGLNKLTSMLYDIQDLDVMKAQNRTTSDHVRVLAIGLIKDCIKEKIEILTSQGAITHALDFIEKTKQQVIKEKFNEHMENIKQQDLVESEILNDAISKHPEMEQMLNSLTEEEAERSKEELLQQEEEDNTDETTQL